MREREVYSISNQSNFVAIFIEVRGQISKNVVEEVEGSIEQREMEQTRVTVSKGSI